MQNVKAASLEEFEADKRVWWLKKDSAVVLLGCDGPCIRLGRGVFIS